MEGLESRLPAEYRSDLLRVEWGSRTQWSQAWEQAGITTRKLERCWLFSPFHTHALGSAFAECTHSVF